MLKDSNILVLWNDHKSSLYDSKTKNQIDYEIREQFRYKNWSIQYKSVEDDLDLNDENIILIPWVVIHELENITLWLEKHFTRSLIQFIFSRYIEVGVIWCLEVIPENSSIVNDIINFFRKHNIDHHLSFYDNRYSLEGVEPHIKKYFKLPKTKNRMLPRYNWNHDYYLKRTFKDRHPDFAKKICYVIGKASSNEFRILSALEASRRNILNHEETFFTLCANQPDTPIENYLEDVRIKLNSFIKETPEQYRSYYYEVLNDNSLFEEVFKIRQVDKDGNAVNVNRANIDQYASFPQTDLALLNVSIETRPYENSLTEKTLKHLKHGKPFLVFSKKGTMKYLQDEGYKLYDWIDYSYDNIECQYKRFYKFFDEVERLLYMPDIDATFGYDKNTLLVNEHNKMIYQQKIVKMINNPETFW